MWDEICKDYIPFDCYLIDINGNKIDRGTIAEDNLGFQYQFSWDRDNQEWVATSLRENNKCYPMRQDRIFENNLKVIC